MKIIFLKFLTVFFLFISQGLYAQLAVDRIIVDFTSQSSYTNDVQLVNTSDTDTLYIKVAVLEVANPGLPEETRVVADDPFKIGLIASPTKLIIPPKSKKLVRLVNLLPSKDQERIYRVNFTPVADERDVEETSVRLMVGYQALIIVRPDKSVFDLTGKRDGNKLILTNKGNTNVYLDTVRQCKTDKLEDCTPLVENRLYPGNTWELELDADGPVAFNAFNGTESQALTF